MNIEECKTKKAELEKNIASHLEKFAYETGMIPESVSIGMVEVTSFGDKAPSFKVNEVNVRVTL